jgi:hypothetical protein
VTDRLDEKALTLAQEMEALARDLDTEADRLPWSDKVDAKMNAASRIRGILASRGLRGDER